jgi:hypothetical protein
MKEESSRFFEKKRRKKLLSRGHASVQHSARRKNFLRSFFLKKRPLAYG